jgi:cholest-4-en-3-one 26-monooxygenase
MTTTAQALRPGDIDLADPDSFRDGVPYEYFRALRREAPVHWNPLPDGGGFWALTKYDDVVAVSMDPVTFSSERHGVTISDLPPGQGDAARRMLLFMDPPKHTKYRRLVSKGFTPKIVREMEPHVRRLAAAIIDGVAERGECDFVSDLAAELPLMVILELLGVPVEDRRMIFDLSNRLIGFDDPEYAEGIQDSVAASLSMFAYANQLAAERRRAPRDDVVSVLLRAEVDGEALSEVEFNAFFLLLAVAGNETTRNLIAGGMQALFEHPDQWQALKADPALLDTAVDEMLRWVAPVIYFRRTATRDTVIRGRRIREGDRVVMYYGSANRDEDVFENAETFDIRRYPNPHVTFGPGGTHFCLGANLARLEIRVFFEELIRRLPDIEPAGPVERLRSNFVAGIKRMPVRWR